MVLSHSLTNDQHHLNTENTDTEQKPHKMMRGYSCGQAELKGVKRKVCCVLNLQVIQLTNFGVEIRGFFGGVGLVDLFCRWN